MTKTQTTSSSSDNEYTEPWPSEDDVSAEEANGESHTPAKARMMMRQKIEELLENRRLNRQIGGYESFPNDDEIPHRMH